MYRHVRGLACICHALSAGLVFGATDGWTNINPDRAEFPPVKVVGKVEIASAGDFTLVKHGGAMGSFSVADGKLRISKTNSQGLLVLKAKPFKVDQSTHLRMFADVEVVAENPDCAYGLLRAYGTNESLCLDFAAEKGNFSGGGKPSMLGMPNTAPHTPYRKYAHFIASDGVVTPVIAIGGTPSSSVWRNWTFEDLPSAQRAWKEFYATKTAKDNSVAMMDEAEFDRAIARDIQHTAEVRTVDGVSRLFVDGKASLPIVYAAKGAARADAERETFHGDALERAGVKIMLRGACARGADGRPRRFWTPEGFDAKGIVEDFKKGMRIAPDSLFVVRFSCNAYPSYTSEHPEEIWRTESGKPVCGTSGSCVIGYDSMGIADSNRWPWVSYSSRRWRDDVKANIRALVAEFRRHGLDKRIVGIHLSGYHDGQFSAPYADYSECAKREYEKYLAENPLYTNYLYFVKQSGFRAQEEFAREFKNALGKKAIAARWCMGEFSGGRGGNYDITAFANSDAIDIIVPQPAYERRHPGLSIGPKLPQASFALHGKMFWYEFDIRTYGALESWASSVVSTKGLGQQDDIVAWRSAYRKMAGIMMALRSGFWFYDMGGGWYSPSEISADIGSSVRDMGTFALRRPSAWRPDVAVVVDEANPTAFGPASDLSLPLRRDLAKSNWDLFAASGVPYESYLAEDVLDHPDILKNRKMVVFAMFRAFDERRLRFVRRLMAERKTLVFLAESGVAGGDVEATGFKTVFDRSKRRHDVEAVKGVVEDCFSPNSAVYARIFCDPKNLNSRAIGPRVTVVETNGVEVVARYCEDGAPAVAYREDDGCRRIYVAEHNGLSPALFNRFAREAGAYVPHAGTGIQVDMNGDFISVHALKSGAFDFVLPFPAKVVNMKSGREEPHWNGVMALELTAGQTCWFRLDPESQASSVSADEGWRSGPSRRRISDPGRAVVWRAPFSEGAEGFVVEKMYGADGVVRFDKDSFTVCKTNDLGYFAIKPKKPFVAKGPCELRTAVREECFNARPLGTRGLVYLYGGDKRRERSSLDYSHWGGGGVRNNYVVNTAKGVAEWKYGHDRTRAEKGYEAIPEIMVSGGACTTRWSDWRIEDGAELAREWKEIELSRKPPDRAKDAMPDECFMRMIGQDFDHTAKVVAIDGRSVLLVDGHETLPVVYKSAYAKRICVHAGHGMDEAGVRLQSMTVGCHWWPNGKYGLEAAVKEVRTAMRTAPNSLFIVAVNLNPYDRFAEDHPSERWIGRDGMVVCGGGGACKKAVKPGEPWPRLMVPCTSYSSVLWRETAKSHLSALIGELVRTGLSKRIVGVHLRGFHDGQFSNSDFPDFSPSALASYRRYTGNPKAEIPGFSKAALLDPNGDEEQKRWIAFIKTEACRVQNDIARHVKKCFGKDIVVVRWSYGPHSGKYLDDYDTREFLNSDSLDILVAQQAYGNRGAAIPFANKIAFASYHKCAKMYLDEIDFRTWSVVRDSEVGLMGLGCSMDLPMWRATCRRAVGRMLAGNMGWWFYDMQNGWFDHPAIRADISDMLREIGRIPRGQRFWKPSAAIVIDEQNILANVNLPRRKDKGGASTYRSDREAKNDLSAHLPKFAASGVPCDIYLADDVLADPAAFADRYKAVAWTCCVRKDREREKFEEILRAKGGRALFRKELAAIRAETFNRFAREAGAYVPVARSGLQVDMNDGFISLHCLVPGSYDFALPYPAKVTNLKTGRDIQTSDDGKFLPLDMEAGETRWYSFRPLSCN